MKSLLSRILVLLLIGVVANIAVAWLIEIKWPNPTSRKLPMPPDEAIALWSRYFPPECPFYAERYRGPAQQLDIVGFGDNVLNVAAGSVGWPFLALSSESKVDEKGRFSSYFELDAVPGRINPLPLRPVWPGFAVNSALYATMAWVFFVAPFDLRRRLRKRSRLNRGLCSACAYPIGVSPVCTECGEPLR